MEKTIVYIASPYTKGDPAINTHYQCKIFNQLLNDGKVWPVVPLWTHFQHVMFPRPYKDWIAYDRALLPLYDACLRLNAEIPELSYNESESSGADNEVEFFKSAGKPVFYSIEELYSWVDGKGINDSTIESTGPIAQKTQRLRKLCGGTKPNNLGK